MPHRAAPAVQPGLRAHLLLRGVCRQRRLRLARRPRTGHLRLARTAGLRQKVVMLEVKQYTHSVHVYTEGYSILPRTNLDHLFSFFNGYSLVGKKI